MCLDAETWLTECEDLTRKQSIIIKEKNEWFTFPSFAKQWHDHSKDLRL